MTYLALIGSLLSIVLGVFVKVKAGGEEGTNWAAENVRMLKFMPFGASYAANAIHPPAAEEGK